MKFSILHALSIAVLGCAVSLAAPIDTSAPSAAAGLGMPQLKVDLLAPPAQCEKTCGPTLALVIRTFQTAFTGAFTSGAADAQASIAKDLCSTKNQDNVANCLQCTVAFNSTVPLSDAQSDIDALTSQCSSTSGVQLPKKTLSLKSQSSFST